jgi:nucleotide-binding universal stress UspA family protein
MPLQTTEPVLDFGVSCDSPVPFKRILVASNGSHDASRALKFAARMAQSCNASLGIVYVVDDTHGFPSPFAWGPGDWEAQFNDLGRKHLDAVTQDLPAGLPVERILRTGDPVAKIVQVATEWRADVIVTGCPSHRGLSNLLHRSVDRELVFKSPCCIMVLGPEPKKAPGA